MILGLKMFEFDLMQNNLVLRWFVIFGFFLR